MAIVRAGDLLKVGFQTSTPEHRSPTAISNICHAVVPSPSSILLKQSDSRYICPGPLCAAQSVTTSQPVSGSCINMRVGRAAADGDDTQTTAGQCRCLGKPNHGADHYVSSFHDTWAHLHESMHLMMSELEPQGQMSRSKTLEYSNASGATTLCLWPAYAVCQLQHTNPSKACC